MLVICYFHSSKLRMVLWHHCSVSYVKYVSIVVARYDTYTDWFSNSVGSVDSLWITSIGPGRFFTKHIKNVLQLIDKWNSALCFSGKISVVDFFIEKWLMCAKYVYFVADCHFTETKWLTTTTTTIISSIIEMCFYLILSRQSRYSNSNRRSNFLH